MTPLEAIEKYTTHGRVSGITSDGRKLWSDGYFILPGDFPAEKQLDTAGNLWESHAARTDERTVELGSCVTGCLGLVYRLLLLNGAVISRVNEAYRQACQPEGATAHVAALDKSVCFRDSSGALLAILMPVGTYGPLDACEPTDEAVWGNYAVAANGFYRQSTEVIGRKFLAERAKAYSERERANERIEEAEADIAEYDKTIAHLDLQLRELRKRGTVAL